MAVPCALLVLVDKCGRYGSALAWWSSPWVLAGEPAAWPKYYAY